MNLKNYIRDVPDFPKKGILFRDIAPLLASPVALSYVIDNIATKPIYQDVDKIVGLDARGFIFGAAIAYKLQKPFVMVRKEGKMPNANARIDYDLEYGTNTFEMQLDSIKFHDKVLLVDDLLATGGSIGAVATLVKSLHATIVGFECIIELADLKGRDALDMPVHAQIIYSSTSDNENE